MASQLEASGEGLGEEEEEAVVVRCKALAMDM